MELIYPAEPEAADRPDGMDRIELIEAHREIIKENIEYSFLVERYGAQRMDETVERMLEVVLSKCAPLSVSPGMIFSGRW